MTNLDNILKSRGITWSTRVHLAKAMVFPLVMYGCESWTIKKAECQRIDAFELWCWRRLLRVPWTARRSNQSILKDWHWSWNSNTLATWCEELTHGKRPWCWERWEEKGMTGWDGWMASATQWTWVWVSSGSWMDRETWHAAVHGVAKSRTWLSGWTELAPWWTWCSWAFEDCMLLPWPCDAPHLPISNCLLGILSDLPLMSKLNHANENNLNYPLASWCMC